MSNVPVRSDASDKAELVTQLFFGECYQVLQKEGNWLQIQIAADNYTGWIDFKQHFPVTDDYFLEWKATSHPRSLDIVQTVSSANFVTPVLMGSTLPFFDGITLRLGHEKLLYNGRASNLSTEYRPAFLAKIANTFLKAPYVWGGKSVFGIDCSGFTQQVMGICGVALPRDAYQQVALGEEVHFVSQARTGDLAFFDNDEGRIIHVGIMLDNQQIIHAHGEVRIDQLDHYGIYNQQRKRYSHKLRLIKRLL
ncbi:C40 family peptidase [Adhaeribacter sp. BT258]|uniref:C40 family peptidase n=1 Tax=Adhaeribacter terrigena TaxID=2793070 RepID=A0ABS1C5V9_9BACT|nr:C40 family peptidase [Adhaeribacter terrigena]MBK0404773.1 C40 family peptidase [Adhaeribacter terrigena]